MDQKIRVKIIAVILVSVSVWAFYQQNDKSKKTPRNESPSLPTVTVQSTGTPLTAQLNIAEKKKESWGRDPFDSKSVSIEQNAFIPIPSKHSLSYILSGIIYNKNLPIAVINSSPYKVGEKIGNAVVSQIYPDSVILLDNNGKQINLIVTKG